MNYSHRHRPPNPISVGAGRRSKTLTRVLSATVARKQLKVPDDQPAQINTELPGTNGRRATPTCPYFHSCRHPLGKRQLTTRVGERGEPAENRHRAVTADSGGDSLKARTPVVKQLYRLLIEPRGIEDLAKLPVLPRI